MRLFTSFLLLTSMLLGADIKTNMEDSNILEYQKSTGTLDYNRLRLYVNLEDKRWENTYIKLILDNANIYSLKEHTNRNKSTFYRTFINYTGDKNMFILGLQRIPFGVGRIWNPIDVFNPIDITAIELNERKGTEALHYVYAINALSNLGITLSKNKQALKVKSFLDVADFALVLIKDTKSDLDIIGYEAEGELLNTNITLRSEGGRFLDTKTNQIYYDYIIGGEYGFENSLILLTEFRHNTKLKSKHLALKISYQPSPLWFFNLLTLGNIDDESIVIAPSFSYSLSDESTLQVGSFITSGNAKSEFGKQANRFFIRYFINF